MILSALTLLFIAMFGKIQQFRCVVQQHAVAFGQHFLRHQHTAHIGVHNNRIGRTIRVLGATQTAHLQALARVRQ